MATNIWEITFSNNVLEITGTKCPGWYEAGVKITPKYSYLDKITFKIKSDCSDIRLTVEQHDYDWFYINLNNYITGNNEWTTVTVSKDNFKNLTWHNNTSDSSDFKFDGTDVTAIYLVYTNGSDGVTTCKFSIKDLSVFANISEDPNYKETILCVSDKEYSIDASKYVYVGEKNQYSLNIDLRKNYYITIYARSKSGELSKPSYCSVSSKYIDSNVVYCGDINIQSYSEKDSVGYNEIYCYIPNEAKQGEYKFIRNANKESYTYPNYYICGYTEKDLDFTGLLPINNIYKKGTDELSEKNLYAYKYSYTEELLLDFENSEVVDSNKFSFNTIVVFYDIYEGDVLKYTSIPLGMYVSGIIEDGVMNNSITKFVSNDDIYSSGTSYGLRICNRFTISSNGTIIKTDSNATGGEDLMYPALSQAMSAIVDSQAKLDQLISGINDYQQGIKDHLAKFKNYRTNVPYIKIVNNVPYWFINGKNTNQKIFYDVTSTSGDNVVFADSTLSENGINIKTYHKEYHSEDINVNQLDYSVDYSDNNIFVTFPTVNIDKTGHVCGTSNKTLLIQLPESVGGGNYKCVQTEEEMNELMNKPLIPGTLVYVEETDKIYIYKRDGFV